MRILVVVQRYGEDIAAGAEGAARAVGQRLAERGHDVEVLTSCARSYLDWADHFAAGTSVDDRVRVHRLRVVTRRDPTTFDVLHDRVISGPSPLHLQEAWMAAQGPVLENLRAWLEAEASRFDVIVFFTYLYWTTWAGLPVAAARVPTVLVPLAHDEPVFHLPIIRFVLALADAFIFLSPEEEALVLGRTRLARPGVVARLGIREIAAPTGPPLFDHDEPYLLAVGRIDPSKGVHELVAWFAAMQDRRRRPVRLVLIGDPVHPIPDHPDVDVLGVVDDATLDAALSGALALVNPSYFESFSLVLAEAWGHGRPGLVPASSPVLAGQVRRSGGGIVYDGFAELEAAIDVLLEDPDVGDALGAAGRTYLTSELQWDAVLGRVEALLQRVARDRRRVVG